MADGRWSIKDDHEGITERIVVTGKLTLETPAHFGNGDVSVLTDMPLLRDPLEGRALLTGTSIAGALRNYLREYEHGYGEEEDKNSHVAQLFGHFREIEQRDKTKQQTSYASLLLVDDALGETPQTELRDGVAIDPKTRTAKEKQLYNIELLQPGTTFNLAFELLIPKGKDAGRFKQKENRQRLVEALGIILRGLQNGEIGLGKRKRRGFGRCQAGAWHVERYDMTTSEGLLAWLEHPAEPQFKSGVKRDDDIIKLLKLSELPQGDDRRKSFNLKALFTLNSSLLIRSDFGQANAPDAVHLNSNGKPILSGTSLAGALRARALRIAKTLQLAEPERFVCQIFGGEIKKDDKDKPEMQASRLITHETQIKNGLDLVQSRVKIDRFTGGAYPGALFSEQPVFGAPETKIEVSLTLLQPTDKEIGLLLLLLKDLWTSDLPLGSESSIGRGRLSGQFARIQYDGKTWELTEEDDGPITDKATQEDLNQFVVALQEA